MAEAPVWLATAVVRTRSHEPVGEVPWHAGTLSSLATAADVFYSLIGPQFIELHVEARETATNVSTAIKVLIWDVPGLSGIKRDANSRGHTEGCR